MLSVNSPIQKPYVYVQVVTQDLPAMKVRYISHFDSPPVLHRCFSQFSYVLDLNECELIEGLCQYRCINTKGSYKCACPDSGVLGEDGRTCKGLCKSETLQICF